MTLAEDDEEYYPGMGIYDGMIPDQRNALPTRPWRGAMFRPRPPVGAPVGETAGFQTGVAANPTNTAYEDFFNQAAAEGRRTQPGGQAGQRIFGGRHRKLPTFPGPTTQPTQPLPRMR